MIQTLPQLTDKAPRDRIPNDLSRFPFYCSGSLALCGICHAQSASSYAQYEGIEIQEVNVPSWAEGLSLPTKPHQPLHVAQIQESEAILRQYLETISPDYPFPITFDVGLFPTRIKNAKHSTVKVTFRVRRLVLTEDDTPGRAIDESSNWNPAYHAFEATGGVQVDKRFVAGELGFALPAIPLPDEWSVRPAIEMWVQPKLKTDTIKTTITILNGHKITIPLFSLPFFQSGFYDLKGRLPITTTLSPLVCEPQIDLSDLPFANGELLNFSFGAGCGYRFRREALAGWKAAVRYNFAKQKLVVSNVADRYYVDQGIQGEISKEFSVSDGFFRAAPWFDINHSDIVPLNGRLGVNVRFYREWTTGKKKGKTATFLADITSSAGVAIGPLSTNRSFTGGSSFEPILIEHPLRTEDYIWMGPSVRGYGFSEFRAPTPSTMLTREGSSFAGISLTIGLPGWARLLFDDAAPEYRQQLTNLADNLTAITRARALEDFLKTESDPEVALAYAQKRVQATKTTLRNLFRHAKQFSIRPLVAYDYGAIMSRDTATVHDWSAGAGLRIWFRLGIAEGLYVRNGGAVPGASDYNLVMRFRFRGSPKQPYPF